MNKRKVIIDTDPGIDDLLALAVAGVLPELDVLAFSTVHGNVSLEHTYRNAVLISELLELDIPVYKGSHKPLFYDKKEVSPVHGPDGLGNLYDKYRKQVKEKDTYKGNLTDLSNLIMNSDEKITLVALGPLTNVAKLILINEDLGDKVDEIHIMGGGFTLGNTSELTEFNFYSDSHAAKIVMESGIPIVISPLDLTHQVYFTEDEMKELKKDTLKLEFIKESIEFYAERDPYMHDVCSIMTLTHPEYFTFEDKNVGIVIGGGLIADGQSYVKRDINDCNIKITSTVEREEVIRTIISDLNKYY